MNRLLVRMHKGGKDISALHEIDLANMLRGITEGIAGNIALKGANTEIGVVADEERLHAVFTHIVQNSVDAAGEDGTVSIELSAKGGEAIIEVTDDGPGMDAKFIRDELFRPFKTTKAGGFGIGAYESREFVREMSGRLDVSSRPGLGTAVRISLPAIQAGTGRTENLDEVGAL